MTVTNTEIELKFLVPSAARTAVLAEVNRGTTTIEKISLAAKYLDTADRRLARAGMAWRLRREGRCWVQTLKTAGANPLERFEHEVIRPEATHDLTAHAGTLAGDRLLEIVAQAGAEGIELGVRFETEIRRTARRVRTRGAIIEVAFDEGRLIAGPASLRVTELEFELVSGRPAAMLALAERWRQRFGLLYDPRSKAERGDLLAEGVNAAQARKACRPKYAKSATALQAFAAVVDECLAQITRNAIGLCDGDPTLTAEHVHQLRVGIRRLRSALKCFKGWAPPAPPNLIEGLRVLFAGLGACRDTDVLSSGVLADLARAGAPPMAMQRAENCASPVDLIRSDSTQRMLLAWIAWRESLAHGEVDPPPVADTTSGEHGAAAPLSESAPKFSRLVDRRLCRWHALFATDWDEFDQLDEERMHELRKRIKRQRYGAEFFAPMLRRKQLDHYIGVLSVIQDRMGELNDLFVARSKFQAVLASDSNALFALGWIAARIDEVRALAKPELRALAKSKMPTS